MNDNSVLLEQVGVLVVLGVLLFIIGLWAGALLVVPQTSFLNVLGRAGVAGDIPPVKSIVVLVLVRDDAGLISSAAGVLELMLATLESSWGVVKVRMLVLVSSVQRRVVVRNNVLLWRCVVGHVYKEMSSHHPVEELPEESREERNGCRSRRER